MKPIFTFLLISFTFLTFGQDKPVTKNNRFKFIEIKSHGGSFLKSEGTLSESGLLDNGYKYSIGRKNYSAFKLLVKI